MSLEVTRANLVTAFLTAWATTPVYVENVQGKPDGNPYILVKLASTFSNQPCLGRDSGATWERDLGDIVLGLHVPVNYFGDALAMAEDARRVLSQQRFNETITDVGTINSAGVTSDERYYLYNITIPFRTDNIKEV